MVQIITYNKNKFQTFADTYKISELGEFDSFDDYNINIIDLSNESMWRYSENIINSINAISDFRTLSKELDLIKKTKIVIVLPQNVYYKYHWINYKNAFNYAIKIKDILPNVIDIISKNLFNIKGFEISYSKSKTTINGCSYKSDFNFNQVDGDICSNISKSDNSDRATSIVYNNYVLTTLDVFESVEHLKKFLLSLEIADTGKTIAPEWFNEIDFFNDKILKEQKIKNNSEIQLLYEKNDEINIELENNNKLKSILYTTGNELVEVVMKILDDMLENNSSDFIDEKKEDFLIIKESITFVGEIKGISSAVSNKNVSQLDVHVQSYIDKVNKKKSKEIVKGLLIINHERTKNIVERNQVHQNQIDLATRNGALIIESTVLLTLYEKFLEKKLNSQNIIKLLTKKEGILQEKDIKSTYSNFKDTK